MRSAPAAAALPGPGEGLGRLERLVGASDTVPADAGVLVLKREGDVRTALEGLDGDAYDLIMRPASYSALVSSPDAGVFARTAAPNGAVADPASLWPGCRVRLLPAASPSPPPAPSPAHALARAALRDMLQPRHAGTGARSERAEIERCAGTHFDPSVVATFLALPLECLEELRGQAIS